ncbi:MAG TPA: hypothetical protein VJV79_15810 [Polyangiaceae bacterium]|nr:hypothetical protein [Polyangiaceae bacterium]
MAIPLPEDVLVSTAGFWNRCAIAVSMNDAEAGMDLLRDMHAVEGKIFLSIVPGARAHEAKVAATGFRGRPMESRFPGSCAVCGKVFPVGARILYNSEQRRAGHDACGEAQ